MKSLLLLQKITCGCFNESKYQTNIVPNTSEIYIQVITSGILDEPSSQHQGHIPGMWTDFALLTDPPVLSKKVQLTTPLTIHHYKPLLALSFVTF